MVSRVAELTLIEAIYVILFLRNKSKALINERLIENALAYIDVWVSGNSNKEKRR